jgi:hypothetical protein
VLLEVAGDVGREGARSAGCVGSEELNEPHPGDC